MISALSSAPAGDEMVRVLVGGGGGSVTVWVGKCPYQLPGKPVPAYNQRPRVNLISSGGAANSAVITGEPSQTVHIQRGHEHTQLLLFVYSSFRFVAPKLEYTNRNSSEGYLVITALPSVPSGGDTMVVGGGDGSVTVWVGK